MNAWPGWSPRDSLILPLEDAPPATPVDIDGRRFEAKHDLHVTVVGTALGAELRQAFGPRLDAATRPAFEALDWQVERGGPRMLVEKPVRAESGRTTVASIIELVELPAMVHFHRWLGELLGRQLAAPAPHITLYTHGLSKGIGIPSKGTLRRLMPRRLHDADLRTG